MKWNCKLNVFCKHVRLKTQPLLHGLISNEVMRFKHQLSAVALDRTDAVSMTRSNHCTYVGDPIVIIPQSRRCITGQVAPSKACVRLLRSGRASRSSALDARLLSRVGAGLNFRAAGVELHSPVALLLCCQHSAPLQNLDSKVQQLAFPAVA